jgi:tetraacyldisaccharide 4'-kinase
VNLISAERRPLSGFAGQRVVAIAAIGHPAAFFAGLRESGIDLIELALPDHAVVDPSALPAGPPTTVLMTEKDAVKCQVPAKPGWWWVDLEVAIDRTTSEQLLTMILERIHMTGAGVRLG